MPHNKAQKFFYQVDLELWSKETESIFTFVNISHIPYSKLQEIFQSQYIEGTFLFEDVAGYQIDETLYKKNEHYLSENILCDFNFKLFEYWVGLSGDKIEKLKRSHYTSWPPE